MSKPSRCARRLLVTPLAVGLAAVTAVLPTAPATADPDHPSKQRVEESRDEVRERAAAVEDIRAELADARARMRELSAEARRLVDKYYREQVKLERSRQRYREAQQRLAESEKAVRRARDRVAEIAVQRYRTGRGLQSLGAVLGADGLQDLVDRMNALHLVTRERTAALDRVRASEIVADVLRRQAHQALEQQRQLTRRVERAKQAAQQAAERQRAEVRRTQALRKELRRKLTDARGRTERLERKREEYLEWRREQQAEQAREARAAQQAEDTERAQDSAVQQATEDVAEITGRVACDDKPVSLGSYSNGLIPPQALCSLPQDGHMLRADAAAAFIRLNAAYADVFGEPICITDSYRSLAVQQSLAERKPELAAEPGTSNHGWGIAVDLCGGINSYGTTTHEWMRDHASAYGWVLPSWARATGSMPEPWHWEYVG